MLKNKRVWFSILTVVPVALVLILQATGALSRIENVITDYRYVYFNPGHEFSKDIVVLEIDEQSLQKLGQDPIYGRWPWKRNAYIPLLEFVAQFGAQKILFDVTFFEESPEDQDLAAVGEAIPIISHALNFRNEDVDNGLPLLPPTVQAQSIPYEGPPSVSRDYNRVIYPARKIVETLPGAHSVTFHPDSDGVARRARHLFRYNDRYYPSLSLAAVAPLIGLQSVSFNGRSLILRTVDGDRSIPTEKGSIRFHYYPEEELYKNMQRYSITSLIETKIAIDKGEFTSLEDLKFDPTLLQGKTVIIGATAAATHDVKTTPYGSMPGVFLHAILASNILNNDFLQVLSPWFALVALILLVPVANYLVIFTHGLAGRVIVPALMLLVIASISIVAFQFFDTLLPLAGFLIGFPLAFSSSVAYLSFTEGLEKRKFKSAMSKYLSPAVLDDVMKRGQLQAEIGERRVMTVMFTDIRSFTTMSEGMDPATVVHILNEYLDRMVRVVFEEEGTLDKYIGDAIMAFWNAPLNQTDHATRAVRTGLGMLHELHQLHEKWKDEGAPMLRMGVGIHTGEMIVGNIGSNMRLDYTVIGDNVNLGSRLEGITKTYGVDMLISEATQKAMVAEESDTLPCRLIDLVAVKGKSIPIAVYEPLPAEGGQRVKSMTNAVYAARFNEAFDHYRNRRWDEAIALYESFLADESENLPRPGPDHPTTLMIERCKQYKASPPPDNWDGSFVMTTK
ncbi:MAG: adenylate/guanylate cyclase domain-containing protein [Leptospiraceae bacterium]|nr:adenylate/guanylate cyclase domain-containing protein [Leptospiraceae bacterium]